MSDTIRVSVVLENAADEVVTARLGRARAAGIRRVVTEGLVDMGDTRPTPLCVGPPGSPVRIGSMMLRVLDLVPDPVSRTLRPGTGIRV